MKSLKKMKNIDIYIYRSNKKGNEPSGQFNKIRACKARGRINKLERNCNKSETLLI